jgi:hypothetical protein
MCWIDPDAPASASAPPSAPPLDEPPLDEAPLEEPPLEEPPLEEPPLDDEPLVESTPESLPWFVELEPLEEQPYSPAQTAAVPAARIKNAL